MNEKPGKKKLTWLGLLSSLPALACIVAVLSFSTLIGYGVGKIPYAPSPARMDIQSPSEPRILASESTTLIASGSFEGDVVEHSQRVIVVDGWTPINWNGYPMIGGGSSGVSQQPEYKPLLIDVDPYRVRSGEQSQCWFWFYEIGDAAIWRKERVDESGLVQASAWAQAWVSDRDDNPHSSPGEMYVSIGIDPDGRAPGYNWPWETSVIWSPFKLIHEDYEQVLSHLVYVEAGTEITVYLRAWSKWKDKHGDVYWDDWAVYSTDVGGSVPQPTYTPYPTLTPVPTYTPYPTPAPACTPGPISDKLYCYDLVDENTGDMYRRCGYGSDVWYRDSDTGQYICPK